MMIFSRKIIDYYKFFLWNKKKIIKNSIFLKIIFHKLLFFAISILFKKKKKQTKINKIKKNKK